MHNQQTEIAIIIENCLAFILTMAMAMAITLALRHIFLFVGKWLSRDIYKTKQKKMNFCLNCNIDDKRLSTLVLITRSKKKKENPPKYFCLFNMMMMMMMTEC